jgi:hypothetical protein
LQLKRNDSQKKINTLQLARGESHMAGKKGSGGAPKGNKHALGCETSGRPGHDRIKIGHDFIKFAKENPMCLTVPMFSTSIGLHSGILRSWAAQDLEFRALYIQAKELIGLNRLKATFSDSPVKLDNSIYRQYAGNFDTDKNEYLREEKKFESDLKKDEEKSKGPTVINCIDFSKVPVD